MIFRRFLVECPHELNSKHICAHLSTCGRVSLLKKAWSDAALSWGSLLATDIFWYDAALIKASINQRKNASTSSGTCCWCRCCCCFSGSESRRNPDGRREETHPASCAAFPCRRPRRPRPRSRRSLRPARRHRSSLCRTSTRCSPHTEARRPRSSCKEKRAEIKDSDEERWKTPQCAELAWCSELLQTEQVKAVVNISKRSKWFFSLTCV